VIRLWNRVGIFRPLSIIVLVAGLAGGLLLAQQERTSGLTSTTATVGNADDVRELALDLADHQNALDKAKQFATSDAEQARAADDQARKNEAASRSDTRTAKPSASASTATTGVNAGPVPASCAAYTGNKAIGCTLMVKDGFGLDQMPCLDKLWTKESHWTTTAANPNGAYGIPQAYPGSKMQVFGTDWRTNPATQIAWGLNYIKGKYSTPCAAWSHSQSTGSY
jgi:hypothetical protein